MKQKTLNGHYSAKDPFDSFEGIWLPPADYDPHKYDPVLRHPVLPRAERETYDELKARHEDVHGPNWGIRLDKRNGQALVKLLERAARGSTAGITPCRAPPVEDPFE